jgi:beta-lactamase class A
MSQTSMADNKTTVFDMGLLLEKIYNGKITTSAKTKELLGFMTDTEFEDRLTKGISENARIYHKTGDGEGFIHDVGIIQTEKGAYYLGVMTSDIGDNEEETKATIRCIPLNNVQEAGVCIYSGKPSTQRVLFARAY